MSQRARPSARVIFQEGRVREREREYISLAFNRACRGCKRAIFVVVFVRTVLNVHITEPFSIFLLGVMYGRIYDLRRASRARGARQILAGLDISAGELVVREHGSALDYFGGLNDEKESELVPKLVFARFSRFSRISLFFPFRGYFSHFFIAILHFFYKSKARIQLRCKKKAKTNLRIEL